MLRRRREKYWSVFEVAVLELEAARVGAVGMILANDKASGNELVADLQLLPGSHVDFASGTCIYNYINSTQ